MLLRLKVIQKCAEDLKLYVVTKFYIMTGIIDRIT